MICSVTNIDIYCIVEDLCKDAAKSTKSFLLEKPSQRGHINY